MFDFGTRTLVLFSFCLGGFVGGDLQPAHAADKVDFEKQVQPILEAACYKCHGEKKGLGGLKLHTPEVIAGLVDDGLVVAGDPESSELYNRLILPADDKFLMPKGGDPLEAEKIELVKRWIAEGALLTSAAASDEPMEEKSHEEKPQEKPAEKPPAAASAEAIKKISEAGGSVVPLFSGSTLLSIGFPSQPDKVTDETVELLLPVAVNIAWLDLGGSQVTDAGAGKLAAMKNLSRLHLERTAVTDASIAALAGLAKLEYLNLYGTKVTDVALAELESAPALTRLYVWQTDVSFEAAKKLEKSKEGLEVNLGWDHPGVVRERLTTELATVVERKEKAAVESAEAEQKLKDAKAQLESATSREAELKAELEALDKPSKESKDDDSQAETSKDNAKKDDAKADEAKKQGEEEDKPAQDEPAKEDASKDKAA